MEFASPSITLPNIHHLKPLNINSNNHISRPSLDSTSTYHLSPSFSSAANTGQESMVTPPSTSVSPGTAPLPQSDYVSINSHSKKSGAERSIFTIYLQPNVQASTLDQLKFTIAFGNYRSSPYYSIDSSSNNPNKYAVSAEVPSKSLADANASSQSETKVPVYLIIVDASTLKDIGLIYVCDFTYEDYQQQSHEYKSESSYPYQPQQQLRPPSPPHSQTYLPLPTLSTTPRINGQTLPQGQVPLKTPTPGPGDVTPLSAGGYSSYYRSQQQQQSQSQSQSQTLQPPSQSQPSQSQQPLQSQSQSLQHPSQPLQPQPIQPSQQPPPRQSQSMYYYPQSSSLTQSGTASNTPHYPQYLGNEESNAASYYDPVHNSNTNTAATPVGQDWNANAGSASWHSSYSTPAGAVQYPMLQDPNNVRQPLIGYNQQLQPAHQPQYQMYQADPRIATQTPQLVRTTALSQAASSLGTMALGSERHLENDSPFKASLEILGNNLNEMATNWTVDEWRAQRRLVQFTREQRGPMITVQFQPLAADRYTQNTPCISCIHWADRNECYVTSVDCIYLLEQLVNTKFKVEEKNRIRRNLEGYHPLTVSKGKPESGEFFKLIMSFSAPKPRNIEKDVKVFPWRILANALKKIIGKYSADYSNAAVMSIRR